MFCFCLSKPQAQAKAWHIIDARSAAYIIKGGKPPLYLITRQRASYLRLDDIHGYAVMIYRNKLRMIYKAYALIYFAKYGRCVAPKVRTPFDLSASGDEFYLVILHKKEEIVFAYNSIMYDCNELDDVI